MTVDSSPPTNDVWSDPRSLARSSIVAPSGSDPDKAGTPIKYARSFIRIANPTPKTEAQKAVFTPSISAGTLPCTLETSNLNKPVAIPKKVAKMPIVVRIVGPYATVLELKRRLNNAKKPQ